VNFLRVGDLFVNLAAIAVVEHHHDRHALKVIYVNQLHHILTGDDAQILLTHLEMKTAASQGKQPSK
jgi:hypothetical protein